MDWLQAIDGLELQDELLLDDNVERGSLVGHWKWPLPREAQAHERQFIT
jgi:hypothetical protein